MSICKLKRLPRNQISVQSWFGKVEVALVQISLQAWSCAPITTVQILAASVVSNVTFLCIVAIEGKHLETRFVKQ
jgi:hypothetical protein